MNKVVPSEVITWFADQECEALRLEPAEFYDPHIVGVAYRFGVGPVIAYDMDGIINSMVKEDGMSYSSAEEYFHFNTLGAWVGEGTPIFIENPSYFMPDAED